MIKEIIGDIEKEYERIKDYEIAEQVVRQVNTEADSGFFKKDVYELNDFIKYNDVEFITNCYQFILGRRPDTGGFDYYLSMLRSGQRSKSEILLSFRFSKEGKERGIKILGLKKRYVVFLLSNLPIIGYFFKTLIALATLPRLIKRINEFESYSNLSLTNNINFTHHLEAVINSKASLKEVERKADREEVERKADKTTLDNYAKLEDIKRYKSKVVYALEQMKIVDNNLGTLIDEAKKRLPAELNGFDVKQIADEEYHKYDNFYVAFEDKFRGTREDIKSRQQVYLEYVSDAYKQTNSLPILDLGCGRGEWLELLQENNLKASGIDLNRVMVGYCKTLKLDVVEKDAIKQLKELDDSSLSVVTGFHIAEHLPFEVLMELLNESFRVLHRGGVVILETPNPENIVVGACNFYTDPTHKNPIPSHTLEFLAENNGFEDVEILKLNGIDSLMFEHDYLNHYFKVGQDYAIIGRKQ